LVEAVKPRNIDLLLMEGTHIGHLGHRGPTECELEDEIVRQVQSAPELVLASFSPPARRPTGRVSQGDQEGRQNFRG